MNSPHSLAEQAQQNPFRFFSLQEVGEICGFGRDTMTALVASGAPVVARKMNPGLLIRWLEDHSDALGKVRED
ncbi:MAG: hypothetical protein ACFUZC_03520 [Chthoniobacteraceae bacterium]